MQPPSLVLLAVLAAPLLVRAQDAPSAIPGDPIVAPALSRSLVVLAAPSAAVRAVIPHTLAVAEFTPPAPPVVKRVPAMRVDATVTIPTRNSRTLTLLRGEASTLPGAIQITRGDPLDPPGTAPITMLRDVIASELARLVPYQAASAAWHLAQPPIPRDESFWFKSHRGSRYLQPAKQGGRK